MLSVSHTFTYLQNPYKAGCVCVVANISVLQMQIHLPCSGEKYFLRDRKLINKSIIFRYNWLMESCSLKL